MKSNPKPVCDSGFAIVIEKAGRNFSAYVPDLPGCIGTAPTRELTCRAIREAIAMHLDGLREDGRPIPALIRR
jgi:predicted RNase H-like HicB family nuclease